jgi:hypothetical protein
VATGHFPALLPGWAGLIALLLWTAYCGWLCLARNYTRLSCLIVLAGVLQSVAIAAFGRLEFQSMDDVAAGMLIFATALRSLRRRSDATALLLVGGISAVVLVAGLRSIDRAAGLAQARQVLIPIGLVFCGYVLRDRLRWRVLLQVVTITAAVVAVWMVAEAILQHPLFDPVPSVRLQLGSRLTFLRQGLPPAYFADGIVGSKPFFRAGGPFLNPPTAGFFMASAAFAALWLRRNSAKTVGFSLIALSIVLSIARAGILILVCVTFAYWAWRLVGRTVTIAGLVIAGYLLFGVFAQQGNTASHSEGLVAGLVLGLRTVVGTGFGSYGYLSADRGEGPSESLLGLYFGWMGIPLILLTGWVIYRLGRSLLERRDPSSRLLWFGIGVVAAAALSETASSLAGTSVSWLLLGLCLSDRSALCDATPGPAPGASRVGDAPGYLSRRRRRLRVNVLR